MNRPAGCGVGLLLVAALAGCTPSPPADAPAGAAASAPPAAAATPDDPARGGTRHGTWARAEGERQGMPITWEYREDYSVAPPRRLPQLVVISQARDVPYVGQSDPSLQQEFTARERQLQAAFGDAAELVAVLDWHQQHDWFFLYRCLGHAGPRRCGARRPARARRARESGKRRAGVLFDPEEARRHAAVVRGKFVRLMPLTRHRGAATVRAHEHAAHPQPLFLSPPTIAPRSFLRLS
ncbi:hypothetical protein ACFJIW_04120 [Tahibacter sp. UC22_41]|uniref:hypothetical protein n=1 Tax=Tahibacter sp. UC22_41 TaxID=3350178 RepID=UPI0036DD3691